MMLTNKVVLITGAGQGVGQGIALAMAAQGAKIAVTGRTLEKLQQSCELIQQRGGEAIAVQCDVKDASSLEQCVNSVVAAFGTIDILVNNAQEVPLGDLHSITDEALEAGWQSGPQATLRLMKLCYPHLKGGGCIVNLASTAAKRWDASGYGAYAAVKEATRALTRAAACEWAKEGIRSNVILPHATSPGLKWWIENKPEEAAEFIASIPMQRVGDCEQDIGNFVAMLCSDNCAYVNGQSIAVDGGQAYMG
ncbi:SDR family NAD(P)-dependent oxidoreductase [Oceanicoccus sp. KOV_DT_Chl]|uniref:SDR family NAD(P)-dependent oxidoreductase n=1 Tax=Oceanicoccus sp. KOV_DT_Chl TaxID=1904639 RepID=UPI000C7D1798|nr:SDR family oxidoreductase [Oceanicoccus sp. KOV_DT_Chl]